MTEAYSKEEARRIEMDYERTAWLAANIMNASGNMKKLVTADDLLGRKKKANEQRFSSKEEREKALNELLKKFGDRKSVV